MKLGPTYPAKVLLIGEYTVLQGGAAIGLPIVNYFSEWDKGTMAEARPLLAFHRYLQTCCPEILDLERWYDDLQSGYFLRSSIPARAGLGSSVIWLLQFMTVLLIMLKRINTASNRSWRKWRTFFMAPHPGLIH